MSATTSTITSTKTVSARAAGATAGRRVVAGSRSSWRALVWLVRSGLLARRLLPHLMPGLLLVAVLGVGLPLRYDTPTIVAQAGAVALVLLLVLSAWPLGHTRSWDRLVVDRLHRRALLQMWQQSCRACGLTVPNPREATARPDKRGGVKLADIVRLHPRVTRCKVRNGVAVMTLALPPGIIASDLERAGPRLASALHVERVVVVRDSNSGVRLTMTVRDMLRDVTVAAGPDPDAPVPAVLPDTFTLGRCEDGTPFRVPVGVSILTAGATGAGKGSVMWGYLLALAPYVRAGLIRLSGIDLKGGMELMVGAGLFHRLETTIEGAVSLLEDEAAALEDRQGALAGVVRSHTPTVAEPAHVIVIDEFASLTAYAPREYRNRADVALSGLQSKGRAPAFWLLAFLQDPRKEVAPTRNLFPSMIGLRLKEASESTMVFGDGTVADLAPCHLIPRLTPGVGYMVSEQVGVPVRFRADYVDDDTIRATAAAFGPVQASTGLAQASTEPANESHDEPADEIERVAS